MSPNDDYTDPQHSEPPVHQEETARWVQFAQANTVEDFCQSWLTLLCQTIPGVTSALVLLNPSPRATTYSPKGIWPTATSDVSHLEPTAKRALTKRQGLLQPSAPPRKSYEVAYPIEVGPLLYGVVVLEVTPRVEQELHQVRRQLYWASAWLEVLIRRQDTPEAPLSSQGLHSVLDLVGTLCRHDRFHSAATAFVTDVATLFHCDRVTVGFLRRGKSRIRALSHHANLDKRTNLLCAIEQAMDEAIDQGTSIIYPTPPDASFTITQAHHTLTEQWGSGSVCTIPLAIAGTPVGALTLERSADQPFDSLTRDTCEVTASLAGPILDTLRRDDRWWIMKGFDAAWTQVKHLFGPRHTLFKFSAATLLTLCLVFATVEGAYRISAETILEPVVLRAVVAPFDGYVATAPKRAGDLVQQDEVLCTLDDRELKLERLKWLSQLAELQKQYHQAMALHELAEVTILSAQMDQAHAQLSLLADQLARTTLQAPFSGVVVSGDLSQQLGSPVEKGAVLFEVAPLHEYRLIVQVDERDITDVAVGQHGTLKLSAIPEDSFSFTVQKLTPVSEANEGRNYFRVEAQLDHTIDRLRPGMEGVGKIEIDDRLLIWVWTHDILDWFRLTWWSWTP